MSAPSRRPGLMYRLFAKVMVTMQGWLNMTCKHFIRRASDKYERRLGLGERMRQAAHRGICSICSIQERRMDQLRQIAHELAHQGVNPAEGGTAAPDDQARLSPEAVERIRAAMSRAKRG